MLRKKICCDVLICCQHSCLFCKQLQSLLMKSSFRWRRNGVMEEWRLTEAELTEVLQEARVSGLKAVQLAEETRGDVHHLLGVEEHAVQTGGRRLHAGRAQTRASVKTHWSSRTFQRLPVPTRATVRSRDPNTGGVRKRGPLSFSSKRGNKNSPQTEWCCWCLRIHSLYRCLTLQVPELTGPPLAKKMPAGWLLCQLKLASFHLWMWHLPEECAGECGEGVVARLNGGERAAKWGGPNHP